MASSDYEFDEYRGVDDEQIEFQERAAGRFSPISSAMSRSTDRRP